MVAIFAPAIVNFRNQKHTMPFIKANMAFVQWQRTANIGLWQVRLTWFNQL